MEKTPDLPLLFESNPPHGIITNWKAIRAMLLPMVDSVKWDTNPIVFSTVLFSVSTIYTVANHEYYLPDGPSMH